jgi:S1-C subfamily serine protease
MKPHHWLLILIGLAVVIILVGCELPNQDPATIAGSSVRIELPDGLGSGVYIGNGIVITAAHVVGNNASVKLISDIGDSQIGEVLWINKVYDIAAIRPANSRRFHAADLACREAIVGEPLVAEGNPVGVEFISMHGYVSGVAREFLPNWKSGFVTDMTVISGMSGGGIYDQFGEVIGITVGAMDPHGKAGEAAAGGMGFAVPSSVVCSLMGRA